MASSKKIKNINKVDLEQLKEVLKHTIKNNEFLQNKGLPPIALNIVGNAGLGKTTAVSQLVREIGYDFKKINLSQIDEVGHLLGFPIKQFEVAKGEERHWIPESAVDKYLEKGFELTDSTRMGYAKPEWVEGLQEGGILFLDDFSRANPYIMQAVMEIIEGQEFLSWKLPKNWTVLLSSNPDNGEYLVSSEDVAMETRYIKLHVKFNVKIWAKWAENEGIDSRCINFILMNPNLVTERNNPRIISKFFNSISSITDFMTQLPLIQMLGEGCVGDEFANLFTMFINNKLDRIVSPMTMIDLSYSDAQVKKLIIEATGEKSEFRSGIAAVLADRLLNYTIVYAKDNKVTPELINRLNYLVTEADLFTNDLKYYIVKGLLSADKVNFAKMLTNKDVLTMSMK